MERQGRPLFFVEKRAPKTNNKMAAHKNGFHWKDLMKALASCFRGKMNSELMVDVILRSAKIQELIPEGPPLINHDHLGFSSVLTRH